MVISFSHSPLIVTRLGLDHASLRVLEACLPYENAHSMQGPRGRYLPHCSPVMFLFVLHFPEAHSGKAYSLTKEHKGNGCIFAHDSRGATGRIDASISLARDLLTTLLEDVRVVINAL